MSNKIFEDLPARKHAPAAAPAAKAQTANKEGGEKKPAESSEKRIRQAVYDIRYRARREEISLSQAFSQYMSNTTMSAPEKSAVKAKLAEEYEANDMASSSVANAMFKVFIENKTSKVEEEFHSEYLDSLMEMEDRKYKVRVKDKKTGKSYVRYATREKISQLRANPNIESVEMTEYGDAYEGEKKKGEQTARAKAGKGLDPVGKEDNDPDNDGVPISRDKNDQYIMKRRKAIGKAIATRTEGVIYEKQESENKNKKVTGEGTDNSKIVKVFPESGVKEGVDILEKAMSKAQQRFMGMVYAAKKGEKPASPEVAKAAKEIGKKEAKKFAGTKHEGLPEKVTESGYFPTPESRRSDEAKYNLRGQSVKPRTVQTQVGAKMKPSSSVKEENACGSSEKEKDTRGDYTKTNLIKNKLRAMGAKNPIVMIASEEVISERGDEPGEGPRQRYGDMRGIDRSGPQIKMGGKFQTQDKTPPVHPAAHLKLAKIKDTKNKTA